MDFFTDSLLFLIGPLNIKKLHQGSNGYSLHIKKESEFSYRIKLKIQE